MNPLSKPLPTHDGLSLIIAHPIPADDLFFIEACRTVVFDLDAYNKQITGIIPKRQVFYSDNQGFPKLVADIRQYSLEFKNSNVETLGSILALDPDFLRMLEAKAYENGVRRAFSWCYKDTPLFDVFIDAGFILTGEFPDCEVGKIVQRFYKDLKLCPIRLNDSTYSKISISEECDADYTEEHVYELLNNPDSFGIFIQDTNDQNVKGGIMGTIYKAETKGIPCGYINFLWLDDSLRKGNSQKKGLGKFLMEKAEKLFKEQGAQYAQSTTNGFQAPVFYEKLGYTVIKSCPGHLLLKDGTTDIFECTKKIQKEQSPLHPTLIKATLADYPTIQNMARFYVYDISRACGEFPGWECPEDGLYESFNFKSYFEEPNRHAFLVRVKNEIAGFVLINKVATSVDVDWNVGEFFILAKFQGKSIGTQIAMQVWDQFPGIWEVSVIPENNKALRFWRQSIEQYTQGHYSEKVNYVVFDPHQPKRVVFRFTSPLQVASVPEVLVIRHAIQDDINAMVILSDQKRKSYEQAQPQFWRRSQNANETQTVWFTTLLDRNDYIVLVAKGAHKSLDGFIVGQLVKAPEVYDPGGLTLMIDDFCVASLDLWHTVGSQLLDAIQPVANLKGAVQNLIVCGRHDEVKREFLRKQGMNLASEWYVSQT